MDNIVNKDTTYLEIFKNSFSFFVKNFGVFMKYMAFPALGITFGLAIAVAPTLILAPLGLMGNFFHYIVLSILGLVVGLVIFCKAFWRYIIAMGSTIYMADDLIRGGFIRSIEMHDNEVRVVAKNYIIYLVLTSLLMLVMTVGIITIPLLVFFTVYLQVFFLEKHETPSKALLQNFSVVKGQYWSTLWLVVLLMVATAILTLPAAVFGFNSNLYNVACGVISILLLPFMSLVLTYWYYKIMASPL